MRCVACCLSLIIVVCWLLVGVRCALSVVCCSVVFVRCTSSGLGCLLFVV